MKPELIKEYEYGQAAEVCGASVTFLDANHCPGAAILLMKLEDGMLHLHTGDMRAHKMMQKYPELVVARNKIENLYLDTTYCHPKHVFQTQDQCTRSVADSVEKELQENPGEDGCLFLLSSYKIGKEKVMMEVPLLLPASLYPASVCAVECKC